MAHFTWKAGVRKTRVTGPVPPPLCQKCSRQTALSPPRNPLPAASVEFSTLSRSHSTDHIPILRVAARGAVEPQDTHLPLSLPLPIPPAQNWLTQISRNP